MKPNEAAVTSLYLGLAAGSIKNVYCNFLL